MLQQAVFMEASVALMIPVLMQQAVRTMVAQVLHVDTPLLCLIDHANMHLAALQHKDSADHQSHHVLHPALDL